MFEGISYTSNKNQDELQNETNKKISTPKIGDCGSGWRNKAVKRALERSNEEGTSFTNDIISRWGSISSFKKDLIPDPSSNHHHSHHHSSRSNSRSHSHHDHKYRNKMKRPDSSSSDLRWKKQTFKPHSPIETETNFKIDQAFEKIESEQKELKSTLQNQTNIHKNKKGKTKSEPTHSNPQSELSLFLYGHRRQEINHLNEPSINELSSPLDIPSFKEEKIIHRDIQEPISSSDSLNKLVAAQLKAKMRGDNQEALRITQQIDDIKSKEQEIIHQSIAQKNNSQQSEVVVLPSKQETLNKDMSIQEMIKIVKNQEDIPYMFNNKLTKCDDDEAFDSINPNMFENPKKLSLKKQHAIEQKNQQKFIQQYHRKTSHLNRCYYCLDSPSLARSALVSIGDYILLFVSHKNPLTPYHCQLTSMLHVNAMNSLETSAYEEIYRFQQCLVSMFAMHSLYVLFFETVIHIKNNPHFVIDCIPVKEDIFHESMLIFHHSLSHCDTEWSSHKKIIKTKPEMPLQTSVPSGFPYVHIMFGIEKGLLHVIEDETNWERDFCFKTLCSLLQEDEELNVIKASRYYRESQNDEQMKIRVKEFLEQWQPFDFTSQLSGGQYD